MAEQNVLCEVCGREWDGEKPGLGVCRQCGENDVLGFSLCVDCEAAGCCRMCGQLPA